MRKQYFGRQLKRDKNERQALFKALLTSLVLYERIETTEAKAKAIKGLADKLVTKAKKGQEQGRLLLQPYLSAKALDKMLTEIGPRFANRPGGYTRIIRVGNRVSDNASVVKMEWTEKTTDKKTAPKDTTKTEKTTDKKTKVEKTVKAAPKKQAPQKQTPVKQTRTRITQKKG